MRSLHFFAACVVLFCLVTLARAQSNPETAEGLFGLPEHLKQLDLEAAGTGGWRGTIAMTEKPAALFYPGEAVNLDIKLEGIDAGTPVAIEVVQIGFEFAGFGGSAGGDPMVSGQLLHLVPRGEAKKLEAKLEEDLTLKLRDLPLDRYGLYAIIAQPQGKGRQPVATAMRGFAPRKVDRWTSPVMYHQHHAWQAPLQLPAVARVGYVWVRTDGFPNWGGAQPHRDKPMDWTRHDAQMQIFRDNGLYAISNMYGSPRWTISEENWKAYHYLHDEEYDQQMGDFVEEAVRRYCGEDGEGPLQIIDYWNEPWEGGGISAWHGDAIRYRQTYKILYERAKKGSPHIKVGGASSIMNTEDKFFIHDTGVDWTQYFDVFTDHYVLPTRVYGPRLAKKLGIFSIETETWLGYDEKRFTGTVVHFLAAGQKMVNPNHPSQVFWTNNKEHLMLKPAGAAANVVLHFLGGRPFERVVFRDHLPWLYQFGTGEDSVFLLAGNMNPIELNEHGLLYSQIRANGRIIIETAGGAVRAFDVWGNEIEPKDGKLDLPLSWEMVWLTGPDEAVFEMVRQGEMIDVNPVEFVIRDLTSRDGDVKLQVEVHNVMNGPFVGHVKVESKELKLATSKPITLEVGQRQTLEFPVATPLPAENSFEVTVSCGPSKLTETIHANVIVRGAPEAIDGDLSDWANVPGVLVVGQQLQANLTERAWRPWEEYEAKSGVAEFRVRVDDTHLYVAVRERNANYSPKPRLSTRDDDKYFGDIPTLAHTYRTNRWDKNAPRSSEAVPYEGDMLQIGIGLGLGSDAHGIPDPENIPPEMVAIPDTDYEYGVWGAPDGVEIWRSYYAGGPRAHFMPRTIRLDEYKGVPEGAKAAVKRVGDDVIYEVALPLADMKLAPEGAFEVGKTVNLTFRLPGTGVVFGVGKSATRPNGLTLLPRWVPTPSNTIRWGIVEE